MGSFLDIQKFCPKIIFLAILNNVEFEFDVEKWFSLQSSTKLKMAKKELVLGQNFWISKNDPWWPHLMQKNTFHWKMRLDNEYLISNLLPTLLQSIYTVVTFNFFTKLGKNFW